MANSDLEPLVPEPVVDPSLPIRPGSGNGAARQPVLPELMPAFDFRAAFESIIERRATVRLAEEAAESKRVAYAHAKKHLEEEQATLSELEDAYTEGARLAVDALGEPARDIGEAAAAIRRDARRQQLYLSTAEAMALVGDATVRAWLQQPDGEQPDGLGRCHVIGPSGDLCRDCGALIGRAAAATYGLVGDCAGACVGVDCPGPPPLEDEPPLEEPARRTPRRHVGKPPAKRGTRRGKGKRR